MLKGINIICFANDWESDPTSKHQVMKILSRYNKILWINSIAMRNPSVSKSDLGRIWLKVKGCFKGIVKVNENLYHFTPLVLPFPSLKLARVVNKWLLKIFICFYQKKLKMKDVQLWTFLPNMVDLVGSLGEKKIIYYCVDEWSKFSFINSKSMRAMEISLLKKADVVLTSAEYLYHDKLKFNPNTHLVTHGVDYEYFSKVLYSEIPIADDIGKIKRPIIGFFGLIHEWIDIDLIVKIAATHPDWSIVLIGKACVSLERFTGYDNIHLFGQKSYDRLVNYCKVFDLGLIPFLVNQMTLNVNPIKLREYLAAGIPVVSTPLPEVKRYDGLVEIGHTHDEIIDKIEGLLISDKYEDRVLRSRRMMSETWDKKVEEISEIITSLNR